MRKSRPNHHIETNVCNYRLSKFTAGHGRENHRFEFLLGRDPGAVLAAGQQCHVLTCIVMLRSTNG